MLAFRVILMGLLVLGLTAGGAHVLAMSSAAPIGTGITVNTTDDELNNDGDCSLREAIRAANTDTAVDACPAGSGFDIITVPEGTYILRHTGRNEDAAATGDLDITASVIINGAGVGKTVIDGDGQDRVFDISPSSYDVMTVTISSLTIRNGYAIDPPHGGGIRIRGAARVLLRDLLLIDNRSQGNGGGIDVDDNVFVTLEKVRLVGNRAELSGGGLSNSSNVIVRDSLFQGNVAVRDGGGFLNNVYATATIVRSTFVRNFAQAVAFDEGGGGLHNSGGALSLTNSTISENRTNGHGGGIYNRNAIGVQGTVELSHVTITRNAADADGNGSGRGGGIYNSTAPDSEPEPRVRMVHTIVAGNQDPNGDSDCWGTLSSLGYNLIQIVSSQCTVGGVSTGNIIGKDPLLLPLANNGGETPTHALQKSSPAVDAGSNASCSSTDQRGVARPKDGDGDGAAVCDIGAYEYDPGGQQPRSRKVFLPLLWKG